MMREACARKRKQAAAVSFNDTNHATVDFYKALLTIASSSLLV
jgi:hypothetical protein